MLRRRHAQLKEFILGGWNAGYSRVETRLYIWKKVVRHYSNIENEKRSVEHIITQVFPREYQYAK